MSGECIEAISKPKAQRSTDVWKTEVENAKYRTYRKCGCFTGRNEWSENIRKVRNTVRKCSL